MKIDFNQPLRTFSGHPVLMAKDGPEATLKDIALDALAVPPRQGESPLSAKEQVRRALLMQRIYQSDGAIDVPAEDVILIKNLIPHAHPSPVVGGAALLLIEPGTE
jgi:hypothetical protein